MRDRPEIFWPIPLFMATFHAGCPFREANAHALQRVAFETVDRPRQPSARRELGVTR
jgi:hypothetical protein